MVRSNYARAATLGAALLAGLAISVTSAGAVSGKVREACRADYKAYCPAYEPETAAARQCMRRVGKGLSDRCIQALKDAGEIPRNKKR